MSLIKYAYLAGQYNWIICELNVFVCTFQACKGCASSVCICQGQKGYPVSIYFCFHGYQLVIQTFMCCHNLPCRVELSFFAVSINLC